MTRASRFIIAFTLLFASFGCSYAQAPQPPMLHSPVVNADGSVTFRLLAPTATSVAVNTDASLEPIPLTKDDNGVWSVTTKPLPPSWYGYTFVLDGKATNLDPINDHVRENYVSLSSEVLVPGTPPEPWEDTAIPHGQVDHLRYTTHTAINMPRDQSGYEVYLPPNYDAKKKGGYPVLYLLHGWSDNETGWPRVGRANFILDTLIDSGKAVPMIVVMPLGYGNLDFVKSFKVWQDPAKVDQNTSLFEQTFLNEIMPAIERQYNVAPGRDNRAVAGLSMGGLESLTIGLHNPGKFAYVIGMSSAIHLEHFDQHFPNLATPDAVKKADLKLLWIACGTSDSLLKPNRDFITWVKAKGFNPVAIETPGAHTWVVWRNNLLHVAPLLFQTK